MFDSIAPTVTKPPAQHLNLPSAITSTGLVPVGEDFAATDSGSGVCSYRLSESVNGGAYTSVYTGSAPTTVRNLAFGTSYRYGVAATDCSGNTTASLSLGPLFTPKAYQEQAASISYAGTWTRQAVTGSWGGYEKYATKAGASAVITWTGRSIAWVSTTASNRGSAKVYVDGVLKTTINLNSGATNNRQIVYTNSYSAIGKHTLKIVVVGTAGHPRVDIDGFAVLA